MTTYEPILSPPDAGRPTIGGPDFDVYSAQLFNTSTGAYAHGTGTYPANYVPIGGVIPYITGVRTVSLAPTIIIHPSNVTITAGGSGSFTCRATSPGGGPETTYTWYKNGVAYTSAASGTYYNSTSTTSTVTVPNTVGDSGTTWYCLAHNPSGNTSSTSATLTVNVGGTAPNISGTSFGTDINFIAGSTIAFTATTSAGSAPMTYTWYKGGSVVFTDSLTGIGTSTYTTPTLTSGNNGDTIHCHVSNSYGSVDTVTSTMHFGVPPVISGSLAAMTVMEGNNYSTGTPTPTINVSAGTYPLTYQWYTTPTSGTLTGATPIFTQTISALSSTCSHTALYAENGLHLVVYISNAFGGVTSAYPLITVDSASVTIPTVYSSPSDAVYSDPPPSTIAITAVFQGNLLSYNWEYRGIWDTAWTPWTPTISTVVTDLTGPTRHSITGTQDTSSLYNWMKGTKFRCTATNSAGSVTTVPATITIGSAAIYPVSLAILPNSPSIYNYPSEMQFYCNATMSDASVIDITNTHANWSSDNSGIISINSAGLAYSQTSGDTFIRATTGSVTANSHAYISSATLSSIVLTPTNETIAVGSNLAYTVIGHWSDTGTNDLTRRSSYSSSNTGVATIGSGGGLGGVLGYPTAYGVSNGGGTPVTITAQAGTVGSHRDASTSLWVGTGGGGTAYGFRPTSGTGSSYFAGAVDTTGTTVDSSTWSTSVASTSDRNFLFTGFNNSTAGSTGTFTGRVYIRYSATSEYCTHTDGNYTGNRIDCSWTCSTHSGSLFSLAGDTGGVNTSHTTSKDTYLTTQAITTADSGIFTGVGISTLQLLVTTTFEDGNLGAIGVNAANNAKAGITIYDVVFVSS